jgi:twitching motility protein PilT
MARIDAFLKLGLAQGCSDLHLAVGVPPMLRMHGDLMPIKFRDLGETELEATSPRCLTQSQLKTLREGRDLDFSYVSSEGGRFRVNVFRKETGIGAAFRSIPTQMPSIDQLGLPPIVRKLCDYHQGMILVTGSTGTGKSTTLAAMIDYLNRRGRSTSSASRTRSSSCTAARSSQVIQRELGTHLPTFAEGVRAAMREDPDVILVGEMRDAETISMAMTAAETGHLVLGTLHTTSATKTIDRIIDALPTEEREQTKSFLAQSLIAVITQVLVKSPDQRARRAVCEVMVVTKAIGKTDHDRSDAPDSEPAADGQGIRHAAAGSGAARRHQRQGGRSGRRLRLRCRQAPVPALRHRHEASCRSRKPWVPESPCRPSTAF